MPTPLVLLLIALLTAAPLGARADEGRIAPDRPDFTDSAHPVGRGVIQIETGLEYARTSRAASPPERRLGLPATLRIGLTEALEVRLESEPFVRLQGDQDGTGFGDLTLGLKYRLFAPPGDSVWPALGVLPFVKLPTAPSPIGSEEPDGGLTGLASFALPGDFDLDLNAGIAALGQRSGGALLQARVGASLSRSLTKRFTAFAEFFFLTREEREGRDSGSIQTGLLYLITPALALDASVQTSLIGQAPDYAVRAGVSVRFDR